MTQEMEQKVLQSLYDRLFQAVTYAPSGKAEIFPKDITLIQLAKNDAINPADFANAMSPVNPKGNLNTAEAFSRMADIMPAMSPDYIPTGNLISGVYRNIVNGARTSTVIDPAQQALYNKAFNYLNTVSKIQDFTGAETEQIGPSQIYTSYLSNLTAYIAAVAGYRTAYLNYDMDKIDDQRKWQANEPLLSNAVTQTYNTWRAQGATQVEQALNTLATSINSSIDSAIRESQEKVSEKAQLASSAMSGDKWMLSYAMPSNWYDPSAAKNFTELTLKSSDVSKDSSSTSHSWNAAGSWSSGLWSVKAETNGKINTSNFHMQAEDFELTAKIGVVRIMRPWFNEFIFRMKNWYINSQNKNGVSNGQIKDNSGNLMPMIPTAFIVARDIKITANFTAEDKSHFDMAISANASVGFGPFKVSGGYSYGNSKDTFKSSLNGGTLSVPGIQIIGWVNQIIPASAPLNSDGKA